MRPEDEVGTVSWWPTSAMKAETIEEALDYLFFMQEVTNAYSTELIWALALALGLTCLYIWRALGLQEAARKHSHMVTSRPVFSSVFTPSVASPTTSFLSAYKNRYAHKDKGEERLGTVGYDVLHTYNHRYCRRRTVPRAVWKRHSTGMENGQFPIPTSSRDVLWNFDSMNPSSRYCQEMFGSQTLDSKISSSDRPSPVQVIRTRRTDKAGTKDATTPSYRPYLYTQSPHQQRQFHQQQMQKLHWQIKQQSLRSNNRLPSEPCEVKPRSGLPNNRTSPSPRLPRPIPAPREEKKTSPSMHPQKESLLLQHPDMPATQNHERFNEKPAEKLSEFDGNRMDEVITNLNKGDYPSAEPLAKFIDQSKELSSTSETFEDSNVSLESQDREKYQTDKNRERKNDFKRNHSHDRKTSNASSDVQGNLQPQTLSVSQSDRSPIEKGKKDVAEFPRNKFLNQGHVLSRHKSASTFLETFAQSYLSDRRRRAVRELHQMNAVNADGLDSIHSKSKRASYVVRKTSDTRVCRKRSKTTQKTYSKGKIASETKAVKASEKIKTYDSAVLRAIKADEESQETDTSSMNSSETTSTMSMTRNKYSESSKRDRNVAGDNDSERNTMYEAGKRLAKLRKRLEESLEQIQKQPGLDKELLEKARSAKMRKRRDELENIILLKDDILQVGSADTVILRDDNLSQPNREPEPNSIRRQSKDVRPSVNELMDQNGDQVSDGEPNHTARHVVQCLEAFHDNAAKGEKKANDGVSQANCLFLERVVEEKNSPPTKYASTASEIRRETEQTGARQEEKCGDNITKSQRLSKPEEQLYPDNISKHSFTRKVSEQAQGVGNQNVYNTASPKETDDTFGKVKSDNPGLLPCSRKILDEESLAIILERQSKRREDLKQRKRSPIKAASQEKTESKTKSMEDQQPNRDADQASNDKEKFQNHLAHHATETCKQLLTTPRTGDDVSGRTTGKDVKVSPIIMDGTQFLMTAESKVAESNTSKETTNQEIIKNSDKLDKELPPSTDMSDLCPHVSTRTLSHLKYEEPSVQQSTIEPNMHTSPSEKTHGFTYWEPTFGAERESSYRRRVRWRRQAERAEKQRMETEFQKTPPPVPPKMTRLNDLEKETTPAVISESEKQETKYIVQGDRKPEGAHKEDGIISSLEKSDNIEISPRKSVQSPRLVRGSFICTIKDKNTVLAAGETGIVKGPPENVEICEEKSLTPRKAATVFDPKVLMEKEKEKQEAERAVKASNREGMASPQFRANVRLFEKAADQSVDRSPSPDSKVKASVKLFEEALRAPAHTVSSGPEQRRPSMRKSRSPSHTSKPEGSVTTTSQ